MKKIKSVTVTLAISVFIPTTSMAWNWDSFNGCVSRNWDHIGCALSEWLDGDYIMPPNDPIGKDPVLAKEAAQLIKKMQRKNINKSKVRLKGKYIQVCSNKKLLSIAKDTQDPLKILNMCYKPAIAKVKPTKIAEPKNMKKD